MTEVIYGFNFRQWTAARRCWIAAELESDDQAGASLRAASRKLLNGSYGMERRGHQSGFTAPARERDAGESVIAPLDGHAAALRLAVSAIEIRRSRN